jgi:hypothetical protein
MPVGYPGMVYFDDPAQGSDYPTTIDPTLLTINGKNQLAYYGLHDSDSVSVHGRVITPESSTFFTEPSRVDQGSSDCIVLSNTKYISI